MAPKLFKRLPWAVLLTLLIGTSITHAQNSHPPASSAHTATLVLTEGAGNVEDAALLRQAGEHEALAPINEGLAPLGETLGEVVASEAADAKSTVSTLIPTSQAEAVSHDKLILNSPVVDNAHILSDSERMHLSEQLRTIHEAGLAQAALVTVPTTNGMPIFDYAMEVAKRWQLGREETDDGLLILVAVNDREIYILTGYGLEGVLPDAAINRIIREDITPSFKSGQYAQGLSAGIARMDERLRADPETLARAEAERAAEEDENMHIFWLFVLMFFIGKGLTLITTHLRAANISAGTFALIGSILFGFGSMLLFIIILWVAVLMRASKSGRRGGGSGWSSGGSSGSSGGGSFGGGFGSGGFSGGGGSFGGGGAGGSW